MRRTLATELASLFGKSLPTHQAMVLFASERATIAQVSEFFGIGATTLNTLILLAAKCARTATQSHLSHFQIPPVSIFVCQCRFKAAPCLLEAVSIGVRFPAPETSKVSM